jgi:hypothetical protein
MESINRNIACLIDNKKCQQYLYSPDLLDKLAYEDAVFK